MWRWGSVAALLLCVGMYKCDFTVLPEDTIYRHQVNTKGLVNCEVEPDSGHVLWLVKTETIDKVIYSSPTLLGNRDKYDINSNAAATGNFSLTINSLQRSDSGVYKCQLGSEVRSAKVVIAGKLQLITGHCTTLAALRV